jgi:hypothetical protein
MRRTSCSFLVRLLPEVSAARPVLLSCDIQAKNKDTIPDYHRGVFVANRMLRFAGFYPESCFYVISTDKSPDPKDMEVPIDLSAAHEDLRLMKFAKTQFTMYTEDLKRAMAEHVAKASGASSGGTDASQQAQKHAVLWGFEAHICVLQTAESLSNDGWNVAVLCDGTCSKRDEERKFALKTMQRMPNVVLTTSEAAIMQLTRDGAVLRYDDVNKLVKEQPPSKGSSSS